MPPVTPPSAKPGESHDTPAVSPGLLLPRDISIPPRLQSAVVTLLEAGCTDAEVAAITGQSRAMVEHYARLVNQEKLARSAILRWERHQNGA